MYLRFGLLAGWWWGRVHSEEKAGRRHTKGYCPLASGFEGKGVEILCIWVAKRLPQILTSVLFVSDANRSRSGNDWCSCGTRWLVSHIRGTFRAAWSDVLDTKWLQQNPIASDNTVIDSGTSDKLWDGQVWVDTVEPAGRKMTRDIFPEWGGCIGDPDLSRSTYIKRLGEDLASGFPRLSTCETWRGWRPLFWVSNKACGTNWFQLALTRSPNSFHLLWALRE